MTILNRFLLTVLICVTAGICNAQIITTFAGTGASGFPGGAAPATAAVFTYLKNAVPDNAGNVYITDAAAHIYQVNPSGIMDLYAGTGTGGTGGDGGPATAAQISGGGLLAVDGLNNIYIAVSDNKIRKINVATGIITSVAGTGTCVWGHTGDGGPALAAEMCSMSGIAVRGTTSPSIYFSQWAYHIVREVSAGSVYAYAGYFALSGGYGGDGGAAPGAQLYYPGGVAADAAGNVYICDRGNRVVRKVNASGIISTYAGNVTLYGYSGDGGPATAASFIDPTACAVDGLGNLYVADYSANVIRKIDAAGIITTLAGNGIAGYSGDNGPAAFAKIDGPMSISSDNAGNVYVVDNNNLVRKIAATGNIAPAFVGGYSQYLGMCVSAAPVAINSMMAVTDANIGQTETWTLVTAPTHGTLTGLPATMTSTGGTLTLTGATYTPAPGFIGKDTFKVSITDDTSANFTTVYVSIDTVPGAGVIVGTPTVCVGGTTVLSDTVAGGVWSVSNTKASVAGGIVTGLVAGTDTVIYTVTNGCASTSVTTSLTISPIASPGTITGLTAVCTGATISLSDAVSGGVWSTRTGNASVSSSGVVSGVTAGVDTVRYTVTLGVCPSYAIKAVTVNTVPAVPPVFGASVVCLGATTMLTSTETGVWSASNANASVSAGGVVTGLAAGSVTITLTVANSCGTTPGINTMTVDTAPTDAGTVTGPDEVCVGAQINLARTVFGGTWSSSDITIAKVTSSGRVTGMANGSATITYTVSNTCGSATTTHALTVGCNTGVAAISTPDALKIYPNPNNGSFYISGNRNNGEKATIVVVDMTGKEILRSTASIGSNKAVTLDVPAGVYLVTACAADGQMARATVVIR